MTLTNTSMITPREAEILSEELSKLPKSGRLLELGTGHGHAASFFSNLKPRWTIYTIDGYGMYGDIQNLFKINENKFNPQGFANTYIYMMANGGDNIVPIVGNTATLPWELSLNVLFIDADHSYDWVKKDTEHFIKFVQPGGLIIYHDYNYNWGVKEYFDEEMASRKGWKTWDREGLAFAKRT